MKRLMLWPVICFILLALAGCAQLGTKGAASAMRANDILAYAQRYSELAPDAQKMEYAQVTQSLSRSKGDLSTHMKAALIFGLPASRYRDNSRALALLNEVQRDKDADTDTRALADLLKDYVQERQKLEDHAARQSQKAAEEQKRADSLQQKLDELKNIEKALTERGQSRQK